MEEPEGQLFHRRSGWVIYAVLLWGVCCLFFTFYYSIIKQKDNKALSRKFAWRQGVLPALRGTIYTSDGKILVSSKLEFFLFWKKERVKNAAEELFGRSIVNGSKISGKEFSLLKPLFRRYPSELWVETREKRKTSPELQKIEEKYHSILNGQDGIFIVMHDRFGKQVPGSLQIIREKIDGKSVTLKPGEERFCDE